MKKKVFIIFLSLGCALPVLLAGCSPEREETEGIETMVTGDTNIFASRLAASQ